MPIPVAREIQHNILTQAARAKAQGPIATDDSTAKSGTAFRAALNNASEGFAKLYLANQRADAIDAYQEYEKELETLRNGAEVDPQTGLPQGFLNLRGDQINQENLDAWTNKIGEAKTKLSNKLKGYAPDIRDEYERKADAEMFGNTNAINGHYLKQTWEHTKQSALNENNDIVQNKAAFTPQEAQAYYNTFVKNHFNYTQSEDEAKRLAEKDMEKLVDANTRRILTDYPDGQTYADAKAYVKSLSGTPGFGKTTADAKLHKLDLDSGKFELTKLTTTPESMKEFFNKNTSHLDELEKAVMIAQARQNNNRANSVGNGPEVSAFADIITRLATAQPDFFDYENDLGVYLKDASGNLKNISEEEASQFRTDWLEFMDMFLPRLAVANEDELSELGISGVLDENTVKQVNSRSPLMRRTLSVLDNSLKQGTLQSMDIKSIRTLRNIVSMHKKNNPDVYESRVRYNMLENRLGSFEKKSDKTIEDIYSAVNDLSELQSVQGSSPIGYDDKSMAKHEAAIATAIANSAPSMFEDPHEITLGSRIYQYFASIGDVSRYETLNPNKDSTFIKVNNQKIMDWIRPAQSTVKDKYGRTSIVNSIYKTYVDVAQQMMSTEALTLVPLDANGEPDPARGIRKHMVFPIDGRRPDNRQANSDARVIRIAQKFGDYLNKKRDTKDYSNFMNIDAASLQPEEREYLKELTKQEFLDENGHAGYTCLDSNVDIDSILLADVKPVQNEPTEAWVGGSVGGFWVENNPEMQAGKRIKNTPFIGPVGQSVKDLDFSGGVADPRQEAVLVQNGYPSYEDYVYKTGAHLYPGMDEEDVMKQNTYLMLSTVAPYGQDTRFVKAQSGEKKALDSILNVLKRENPNLNESEFFKRGMPTYRLSESGYRDIERIYEKVRKSIIAFKREMYYTNLGKRSAAKAAEKAFGEEE